jgi:hypothetical protein
MMMQGKHAWLGDVGEFVEEHEYVLALTVKVFQKYIAIFFTRLLFYFTLLWMGKMLKKVFRLHSFTKY